MDRRLRHWADNEQVTKTVLLQKLFFNFLNRLFNQKLSYKRCPFYVLVGGLSAKVVITLLGQLFGAKAQLEKDVGSFVNIAPVSYQPNGSFPSPFTKVLHAPLHINLLVLVLRQGFEPPTFG